METTTKILTGAIGGALLLYGIQQRSLNNDISHGEGFLGIGFGVLLLLSAILS